MGDYIDELNNVMPAPGNGRPKRARIDKEGNFVAGKDVYAYNTAISPPIRYSVTRGSAAIRSVLAYGAVGDGVTDDTAAFNRAFAAAATSSAIYMPTGTYKISASSFTQVVSFPSNFALYGDGKGSTTLVFTDLANAAFFYMFRINNNNITFRDFSITWVGTVNASFGPIIFDIQTSDSIKMVRLGFDMGVYDNGGSRSWFTAIWNMNSGTATNYTISNCCVKNNVWAFLKSNTNTSTQRKWQWINNSFSVFFAPQLTFNTPSGIMSEIMVIGNHFQDSFAADVAATGANHCGGVAGNANTHSFVFANNTLQGRGSGFHFEEGANNVVITGNTFRMTDEAVELLDNNVGGVRLSPSKFVISNNVMQQEGTVEGTAFGVSIINDASGEPGGLIVSIKNNVISGYQRGITLSEDPQQSISVTGNLIDNCTIGLQLLGGVADVSGNVISNCATALDTNDAFIGTNTFYNNTALINVSNLSFGMDGFVFTRNFRGGSQLPNGVTNFTLFPLPAVGRVQGVFSFNVNAGNLPSERYGVITISWDGAVLTQTAGVSGGTGLLGSNTLSVVGNNLNVALNNTGGSTDATVTYKFAGAWFLS